MLKKIQIVGFVAGCIAIYYDRHPGRAASRKLPGMQTGYQPGGQRKR